MADETWSGIHTALCQGARGLSGKTTLHGLLAKHRGARDLRNQNKLSRKQVVDWARQWYERTGKWPRVHSGKIPGANGESWTTVNYALVHGNRGLPGGLTLTRFLQKEIGGRVRANRPTLTFKSILEMADAHHAATGHWPTRQSGPVLDHPQENWLNISAALVTGGRGLPGGITLGQLLERERGVLNRRRHSKLTYALIANWARQFIEANGRRPTAYDGAVVDRGQLTGDCWSGINTALKLGKRGLPGKDSLYDLLYREGLAGQRWTSRPPKPPKKIRPAYLPTPPRPTNIV